MRGLFFLLILLAPTALGAKIAGPYQTILYWYAYRMEIKTWKNNGKERMIATGCKGSFADGSCKFNEFLKHLAPSWTKDIGVAGKVDLPVKDTMTKLRSKGYPDTAEMSNLIDAQTGFKAGMEKLTIAIQKCREKLGDEALDFELQAAKEAAGRVRASREKEQAPFLIKAVKDKFGTAAVKIKHARYYDGDYEFKVLNTQEMIDKNPEIRGPLESFIKRFNTKPGTEGASHYFAIQMFANIESTLEEKVKPIC